MAGAGDCRGPPSRSIVEAAGKSALVLYLEDPPRSNEATSTEFDRLLERRHLLGSEVATVPEEYGRSRRPTTGSRMLPHTYS